MDEIICKGVGLRGDIMGRGSLRLSLRGWTFRRSWREWIRYSRAGSVIFVLVFVVLSSLFLPSRSPATFFVAVEIRPHYMLPCLRVIFLLFSNFIAPGSFVWFCFVF